MRGHGRVRPATLLAAAALALAFGPALIAHVRHAADPHVFNDDVRQQVFPFFRGAHGPAGPDTLGQYQLDLMPVGFKALYRGLEPLIDPEPLSKALPYVLLVVLLVALALASRALGGGAAALMTLALALQTPVFLERIMGGMPRGFAFPLIALGLWAAATARLRVLAVLTAAAPAFYFVSAAVLGLMLVTVLLILPQGDRGEARTWSLARRVSVIALVGTIGLGLALPVTLRTLPWGRLLGPGDEMRYPEIGPGGRFDPEDRVALKRLPDLASWRGVRNELAKGLNSPGAPFIAPLRALGGRHWTLVTNAVLAVLIFGLAPLAWRSPTARRALALPMAGIGGYLLAHAISPYLYVPQRYAVYTMPLFAVAFLPASGGALAALVCPTRWQPAARSVGACLTAAAALLLTGGRGDAMAGYTFELSSQASIYETVRALPEDALIAGWPDGVVDSVPYVSRRRTFITRENHMVFNEGYVREMRTRMDAIIRAFYATDTAALSELRDRFGVTHLIVDARELSSPPKYFLPFTLDIERLWHDARGRPFGIQGVIDRTAVFRNGSLALLDLAKL